MSRACWSLAVCGQLLLACSASKRASSSDGAAVIGDTGAADGQVAAVDVSLTVEANAANVLSARVSATTSAAVRLHLLVESPTGARFATGRTAPGTDHVLTVVGMRAQRSYRLIPVLTGDDGSERERPDAAATFETGALPAGIPAFEVAVHDRAAIAEGVTIFGVGLRDGAVPPGAPSLYAVDADGEVVWYYADSDAVPASNHEIKQLDGGELLVSHGGDWRIITIGGATVRAISADLGNGMRVHHDLEISGAGEVLALGRETRELDVAVLGGLVALAGDVLVRFDASGAETWQWSAFDRLDTTRFPGALSRQLNKQGVYDWTHGNALVWLEQQDAALLSLRSQHWIIKLSLTTGEVLWRLGPEGDFTLEQGQWFYAPHAPEPDGQGRLLVYDNGVERPGAEQYSRALLLELDEQARSARAVWDYRIGGYTPSLGDADRLANGNVLVCAGGITPTTVGAPIRSKIVEVTADTPAREVWSLTVEGHVYRATRIRSFWPHRP